MKIPVNNLGQVGIVSDVMNEDIPVNAWTVASNVDFRDNVVSKAKGYSLIFGANTQASTPFDGTICRPQWMMPYQDPETDTLYWIICGIDDGAAIYPAGTDGDPVICVFNGTQILDRTGTDLSTSDPVLWNGGVVNGLPVVNNAMQEPQMWSRTAGVLNTGFESLTNWPSGYTADVIRVYKDFLVALSVDDGTNAKNPWRVMWSDAAEPFTAPEWTPAATNRAGDVTLGEGGSFLVDCLPLRGTNIVYSQGETWAMRYVGGNSVFAFDRLFSEYGLLAQRCVKPFKDGMHFVVTVGDIIVHDGNTAQSIVDNKVRDSIFGELDPSSYTKAFVVSNYKENEMWFYYPTSGYSYPNKIAKWNIKTGAWSFMTLNTVVSHVGFGVVSAELGSNTTWDSDTGQWDNDTTVWNESVYNPNEENLIMAEYGTTTGLSNIYRADDSNSFDGTAIPVVLERTGLSFAGINQGYINLNDVVKHCDEVWLNATGGPFYVSIGASDTADGPYSWGPAVEFDPLTDYKVDGRSAGRYLGVRFTSNDDVAWRIGQYSMNILVDGER